MQRPSNLCPGYTNVEAFGPDEDYESEEEIHYITLDLGDIEPQLVPSSTTYRLIESLFFFLPSFFDIPKFIIAPCPEPRMFPRLWSVRVSRYRRV